MVLWTDPMYTDVPMYTDMVLPAGFGRIALTVLSRRRPQVVRYPWQSRLPSVIFVSAHPQIYLRRFLINGLVMAS